MIFLKEKRQGEAARRMWPKDAGITLTELLAATALAGILLASIYYVYATSSRSYRMEQQVVRASETLRLGMDELKRAISLAGFLATPDSDTDPSVCPKPPNRIVGLYLLHEGDTYAPEKNVHIQPYSITLFGAYASQETYYTASVIGNIVTLQNPPADEAEFNAIFKPHRMLRIVNKEQFETYHKIQSANYADKSVTLVDAPPVSIGSDYCGIQGFGEGLEVNVVGYVRYRLATDLRDGAPIDSKGTYNKIDLVREELDPEGAYVAGTRVIVAEWVVDLSFYDFVMDEDISRRDPNLTIYHLPEDVVDNAGGGILSPANGSKPYNLRFLTVALTVRTPDEDPSWVFFERKDSHDPILSYDADTTLTGSARTLSIAQRVGLPAFLVKNIKP
jgi:type II secretory pathway pseudopilin PulG